jgi:hypothetical protein
MKYLIQYENFWDGIFLKKDKLSKGDYVRVKKCQDIGQIEKVLKAGGAGLETRPLRFIVKFNNHRREYTDYELEKITKDEFELESDIKKYNL